MSEITGSDFSTPTAQDGASENTPKVFGPDALAYTTFSIFAHLVALPLQGSP